MKTMLRLAAIAALAVLCAVPAAAQWPAPCTVTIPQGAAISAVVSLASCNEGSYAYPTALTPLEIVPPDELEATSVGLYVHVCTTAACTSSKIKAVSGTLKVYTIPGGATPTGTVDIPPTEGAGWRWIKLQIVTAAGVAVTQATAARTFTMFVRPL